FYLAQQGWNTTAYIVRPRKPDDPLVNRLSEVGGKIKLVDDQKDYEPLRKLISEHAVLLDGILGTGIKLPLKEEIAEFLENVNDWLAQMENPPKVVAVDCPSGVDCESGEAAPQCIPADLTVTMAAVKTGLLQFPTYNLIGQMWLVDIGLEDESLSLPVWNSVKRNLAYRELIQAHIPARPFDAHKGTFGTAILVAGSLNYTGAALLAGEAAFRVGAGLITLAVPQPLHAAISGNFPESTWLLLPYESGVIDEAAVDVLLENMDRATAIMLGPGFGTKLPTEKFMQRFLHANKVVSKDGHSKPTLIIDADGLKLLTKIEKWPQILPSNSVLTPHPGEMSVLTGLTVPEIQANRLEIAEKYAQEWDKVLVLKGANTVVASPDGRTTVIPIATPALARAGTGDVLSGLIVGLLAQGVEPFFAAVCGCWIHAKAGLMAAENLGTTASVLARDVLAAVIQVMGELNDGER
ncbi:MAG: NAD(P)H-hydrate dehydratase, partial [Anaerolineales bacterium]